MRIKLVVLLVLIALGAGAAGLLARQERQSALDRKLVVTLRHGGYREARFLLDQGADPNVRLPVRPPDRWQALLDLQQIVRWKRETREYMDPPLLLCRPRVERSRQAAVLPDSQEMERAGTLEALIGHGAHVDDLTSSGLTLLQTAVAQNDETLMKTLLNHRASLVPALKTPPALNFAAGRTVSLLIAHGADVDSVFVPAASPVFGFYYNVNTVTPLTFACRSRDLAAVRLLLEHGAKPRTCTGFTYRPHGVPLTARFSSAELMDVCMAEPALLDLFFKRYGDVNRRGEEGVPLLEEVRASVPLSADRKEVMCRLLLERGAH